MIICKDNQLGVDILLPACLEKENLSKDTITAGFIQVKNAEKYKLKVDRGLLDAMHPLSLGLFSEDEIPRLVIRVVFALASWQTFPIRVVMNLITLTSSLHSMHSGVWVCRVILLTTYAEQTCIQPYQVLLHRSLHPLDTIDLDEVNDPKVKAQREDVRRTMAALVNPPKKENKNKQY